jgi:hypothetical protein
VQRVVRQLDREAALAQDADDGVHIGQRRRPGLRTRLEQPRGPRVTQQGLARSEDRGLQAGLPVRPGLARQVDFADDEVGDAPEQVVLVADMRIERHRLDAERLADPAHADRIDALAIRQADRRAQHPLARQGSAAPGPGFEQVGDLRLSH